MISSSKNLSLSSSRALPSASVFTNPLAISTLTRRPSPTAFHHHHRRHSRCFPTSSSSSPQPATPHSTGENVLSSKTHQPPNHLVESSRPTDPGSLNYALANPNGKSLLGLASSTESYIEKTIFDFRFLALFAVGAYKVYWTSCVKGIHTGNMVLRLVEAIDVYLAGTVMLIFVWDCMDYFSNLNPELPADVDRALKGSSLLGMFAMKERPKWMKISSLDELKTKVGHVIVMILLVKMFERSKMVSINTGMDLLTYSVCIFLLLLLSTSFIIFTSRCSRCSVDSLFYAFVIV
ncbi:uncharacterized protein LOC120164644 [Hibiscus syriacus]|uniref:uncharacterized protein LOC120164644 n=1 Tax=Hibiscus syriacus TaxID=106335 RepID=UPI0019218897|nr:uncharacterized protein LOC120164644 [Hibiscus syriacus]